MKKALKKLSLFFIVIISALLLTVYFVVTQPLFFSYQFPAKLQTNHLTSNAKILEKHVKWLSENDRTTSIAQKKSAEYIIAELNKSGIANSAIEIQDYRAGSETYQNIIVHFDSTRKDARTYLIGAHYDVYSGVGCFSPVCLHKGFPGADDNASGVAGLLEIARVLALQKERDRQIDLAFYSTEEPPFYATKNMGSYQHAKNAKNIDLAIILEMIGYYSTAENSQQYPVEALKYFYPSQGNFIAIASNIDNIAVTRTVKKRFQTALEQKNLVQVVSINAPTQIQGIDFSDHRNYWQFDIPAVMITDTSFYRNFNYHTTADTYDKLNYRKMKAVVDAVIMTVLSLDVK